MPPVRTARRASNKNCKSHYETPIIKIVIGEEEAVFKINEGLLRPTAFFAKERRLNPKGAGAPPIKPPNEDARQPAETENGRASVLSDTSERTIHLEEEVPTIDLTTDDADFVLKGKFCHTREAFAIFVRSLNDAPPLKAQTQEDCRALFKAYALAQEYDYERLQNEVIGALQSFYNEYTIPLSDMFYFVERWGDRVECFLAGYLIAQVAHEMAADMPTYSPENPEVEQLFTGGMRNIGSRILRTVAQYAHITKGQDPSKQKRDWRFQHQ